MSGGTASSQRAGTGGWRLLTIVLPALWLVLFVAIPFAIVAKISLSEQALARPPYKPAFDWGMGLAGFFERIRQFSFEAYRILVEDGLYLQAYLYSLGIAAIATALTLIVAYPFAYAIARAPRRWRGILLVLAIAPFWTSFLIRVYAWIAILKDEGLLNHFLMSLGLISQPLHIYATPAAVLIGIVYTYLPFMILPVYNAIEKQDPALIEAALDLGASRASAFWRITVPLSAGGIAAGCLLVFIPSIGEFVIPDLLGSSSMLMVGRTLWDEFFQARNWPGAAAVAVVLLALLAVPLALYLRMQKKTLERGA
ncbi:MAG: ABC transporter permease [Beijerinckiaceae bacterium]